MSSSDNEVWQQYLKDIGQKPKNASQLMKWSKSRDFVKNLSFTDAKRIFQAKIHEPLEEEVKVEPAVPDKPKVDMTAEKAELKEYIEECKEELNSLQNRALTMEDDHEEGMEGLMNQLDEVESALKKAREQIANHRKEKYVKISSGIRKQKETLQNTVQILRKTLAECDIKGDKEEVQRVLASIPQLEEIEEYRFTPINIEPTVKILEALRVQSTNEANKE